MQALGQGGRRSWDGKELVEFFSGAGSRARCPSPLGALVIVTGTDELWCVREARAALERSLPYSPTVPWGCREGGQGMLAPLLSATDSTYVSTLLVA